MTAWRLDVYPSVERRLGRLPEGTAAAMVEFMVGPLLESPERVGKPLRNELEGYWAARRGPYRIVYGLSRRRGAVEVVRIEHRADVHRPR